MRIYSTSVGIAGIALTMTDYEDTIKKLRADYDWRGPSGKAQRHLVVPRNLVKALLDVLDPPVKEKNDARTDTPAGLT